MAPVENMAGPGFDKSTWAGDTHARTTQPQEGDFISPSFPSVPLLAVQIANFDLLFNETRKIHTNLTRRCRSHSARLLSLILHRIFTAQISHTFLDLRFNTLIPNSLPPTPCVAPTHSVAGTKSNGTSLRTVDRGSGGAPARRSLPASGLRVLDVHARRISAAATTIFGE